MSQLAAPSRRPRLRAGELSAASLAAYALPAAPISAIDTPISIYIPAFYAASGGGALSLGLVGGLILAARVAEVPLALGAGLISDAFGPAAGRRRFWLAAATPLAMLAIWRLFVPPPGAGGAWLLGWLLAVILSGVLLYLNHISWGSEAAGGYDGRTRVQAVRQAASIAGLVLVLIPPILIERTHPPDLDRARMAAIAGFFLLLLPTCLGVALALAPERPSHRRSQARVSLATLFAALAADRALRRLLAVDLLDSAALGVVTGLFVFLSRDVWRLGGVTSLLLLAYLASGLTGLAPILRAVRGWPKTRAAGWLALAIAAALPSLALVPAHAAPVAFAAVLVLGLPSAVNTALFDSLMGDVAAADAARGGASRAGLYYALHMIVGRLGRGVAVAGAFALLQAAGFHPGGDNTPAALAALRALFVLAPVGLQLAMAALLWRFPEPARS